MKKMVLILMVTVVGLCIRAEEKFSLNLSGVGAYRHQDLLLAGEAVVIEDNGEKVINFSSGNSTPLRFANKDILSPDGGNFRIVFKLNIPESDKLETRQLFSSRLWGAKPSGMMMGVNRHADGKHFIWWYPVNPETGKTFGFYVGSELENNKYYEVVCRWDDRRMELFLDGKSIARRSLERKLDFAGFFWVGGSALDKFADVVVREFRISAARTAAIEVSPATAATEIFRDEAEVFGFVLENPDSASKVKLRPAAMKITAGARYYVNGIYPLTPFEIIAGRDGELEFEIPPAFRSAFVITPVGKGNLLYSGFDALAESSWRLSVNDGGAPVADPVDAPAPDMSFFETPRFEGDKVSVSADKRLVIEKTNPASMITVTSREVELEPGKRYSASAVCLVQSASYGSAAGMKFRIDAEGKKPIVSDTRHYLSLPCYIGQWKYIETTLEVPADYQQNLRATLSFESDGAPSMTLWASPDIRQITVPPTHLGRKFAPLPEPDMEQVKAEQGRRPVQNAKVVNVNGTAKLEVNGEIIPFVPFVVQRAEAVPEAVGQGAEIIAYYIPINFWGRLDRSIWKGKDDYDFEILDKALAGILAQAPQAKIFLGGYGLAHVDFAERVPDSRWVAADGRRDLGVINTVPEKAYSLISEEVAEKLGVFYRKLGEHLAASPLGRSVIGVHISGGSDGQWYPPSRPWHFKNLDYSEGSRKMVASIIREKYRNNLAELRRAWQDQDITFDTITVPTPEEMSPDHIWLDPADGASRRIVDCVRAYHSGLVRMMSHLCGEFKKGINRPAITTTYAPGNVVLNRDELYRAPLIDGFAALSGYMRVRGDGGANPIQGHAAGSVRHHNKLFISEVDQRSEYSDFRDRRYRVWLGMADGLAGFESTMRRMMISQYTVGAYGWFRPIGQVSAATWSGPFAPIVGELIRAAVAVDNGNAMEIPIQATVFFDDNYQLYMSRKQDRDHMYNHVASSLPGLHYSGLSANIFLLKDLRNNIPLRSKIYLFTCAAAMSDEDIAFIRENLQKDGNVLIFANDAARLASGTIEENIFKLTGMKVKSRPEINTSYSYRRDIVSRIVPDLPGNSRWSRNPSGPLFYVDDNNAKPLALLSGTSLVGVAVRKNPDWTGCYIGGSVELAATPGFWRKMAEYAGISPLGPAGDYVSVGNGLIMIHSASPGMKTLNWGRKAKVLDLISGQLVGVEEKISFPMKYGETRYFQLLHP